MQLSEVLKVGKTTCFALVGIRGRVGDFVFRQLKSGTHISRRPRKPSIQTEGTKLGLKRFRLATEFAKREIKDPEKKAYYQKIVDQEYPRIRNAYTAAIKAYMNNPETAIKESHQEDPKKVISKRVLKRRKDTATYRSIRNRIAVQRMLPPENYELFRLRITASVFKSSG